MLIEQDTGSAVLAGQGTPGWLEEEKEVEAGNGPHGKGVVVEDPIEDRQEVGVRLAAEVVPVDPDGEQ